MEKVQLEAMRRDPLPEPEVVTLVVDFFDGPNGVVLVRPPRDLKEEQDWVDAYGQPYSGPRLRPPPPGYEPQPGGPVGLR